MRPIAHFARNGFPLISALALIGVAGCGGGSHNGGSGSISQGPGPVPGGNGRLALTVQWPEPGRLVPAASQSVKVVLASGGNIVGQSLIARPSASPWTSVATFDNLPAGTVTLASAAYPNADGTGTAQANGATTATITAGKQTNMTVTMASTVDHLALSPASPEVKVGAAQPLTLVAYDHEGNLVLTAPQKITWSADSSGHAVVDPIGMVTGVSAGTAQITATETESGKSASTTVAVSAVSQVLGAKPLLSVMDQSGKYLYVADNGGNTLSQFQVSPGGGLSPLSTPRVSLPKAPYALVVDPAPGSHYLYAAVADTAGGTVYQFTIQADGTLAPLATASVPGLPAPMKLLAEPTGKFVYWIDNSKGIRIFRINADGTLAQQGADYTELGLGTQLYAGAISPDGKSLYVNAYDHLQQLHIQSDGTLTRGNRVTGYANGMSVNPTAPYLYVTIDNGIQIYHLETDGSLAKVGSDIPYSNHAFASVVSPNGKYLYVVALDSPSNQVAQYAIHPDGTITPLAPATVLAGSSPTSATVSPDGKYLYVTNNKEDTISQYQIAADGTLVPLSPPHIGG